MEERQKAKERRELKRKEQKNRITPKDPKQGKENQKGVRVGVRGATETKIMTK